MCNHYHPISIHIQKHLCALRNIQKPTKSSGPGPTLSTVQPVYGVPGAKHFSQSNETGWRRAEPKTNIHRPWKKCWLETVGRQVFPFKKWSLFVGNIFWFSGVRASLAQTLSYWCHPRLPSLCPSLTSTGCRSGLGLCDSSGSSPWMCSFPSNPQHISQNKIYTLNAWTHTNTKSSI